MNGSHHSLVNLEQQRLNAGELYLEFIRQPDISAGLYVLPVGGTDPQKPHLEHRFHSITEELRVIVVFGPAEYSRKAV
jgi:hypothetical protein